METAGKPTRGQQFIAVITLLTVIYLLFTLFIYSLTPIRPFFNPQNQISPGVDLKGEQFFLLGGLDSVEKTHRTDTIMAAHLDYETKSIQLLSIPRDTRVLLSRSVDGKEKFGKINSAYGFGGVEKLRVIVEGLLGIEIHNHLLVDYQALVRFVDSIGGVEVEIEEDMHYEDLAGGLKIDFKKGPHLLSGKKSLEYLRFRGGPRADLGRISRQQGFLKSLFKKLKSASVIFQLPGLLSSMFHYFQTDLGMVEGGQIARYFINMNREKLRIETIPGNPDYVDKISYFLVNEDTLPGWVESKIPKRGQRVDFKNLPINPNLVPEIPHQTHPKEEN